MRDPEEPVSIDLFRQNPVFTSLHLKNPVHVVPPLMDKVLNVELSMVWFGGPEPEANRSSHPHHFPLTRLMPVFPFFSPNLSAAYILKYILHMYCKYCSIGTYFITSKLHREVPFKHIFTCSFFNAKFSIFFGSDRVSRQKL
jgi:hypothetical protein